MSEGDSFESDEDVDDEITSGVALGESAVESLIEMSERLEISGVDGASEELDMDKVSNGLLSPVFFGSALRISEWKSFYSIF